MRRRGLDRRLPGPGSSSAPPRQRHAVLAVLLQREHSGRDVGQQLDVRVTGATVPGSLEDFRAGLGWRTSLREGLGPARPGAPGFDEYAPNLHYQIPWDGTDAYGRPVQGKIPIYIRTSFVYPAIRYESIRKPTRASAHSAPRIAVRPVRGLPSPPTDVRSRRHRLHLLPGDLQHAVLLLDHPQRAPQRRRGTRVGSTDWAAGRWTSTTLMTPTTVPCTAVTGSSNRRTCNPLIRTTVAGAEHELPRRQRRQALAANIDQATDVAAAPDGTVYILSLATSGPASGGLRRVEPDGTIFEVADSQEIGLMILFGSITVDEQGASTSPARIRPMQTGARSCAWTPTGALPRSREATGPRPPRPMTSATTARPPMRP